ncbi:MAG TPA: hypothetical protein VMH81_17920 [Bryobacteraceae bacterium]|nr:hypothetical protein [Bryobacteraceae bacterium]
MSAPASIKVEPFQEKCWLQISYLLDALQSTRNDRGETLPAGTFGKSRTTEKDGQIIFNISIPKDFPSSWLRSVGVERPDCSLRAGEEESGDADHHVLKLAADQFSPQMKEHLAFLKNVENSIGIIDVLPEGGEPRAFLGYGLYSVIVKGDDYIFRIPADISVRPFAAFLGIDRKTVIREAVVDSSGTPVCDQREVPLHSFKLPVASVRRQFQPPPVEGQKTVTFTLKPKPE